MGVQKGSMQIIGSIHNTVLVRSAVYLEWELDSSCRTHQANNDYTSGYDVVAL